MNNIIRHFTLVAITFISLLLCPVFAEETSQNEVLAPPEITPNTTQRTFESRTVYESSFLPGVRLCEEDEVDYRGDFRRVNCQDEELIESVSTRNDLFEATTPSTVVDNTNVPNGNILRIQFQRKVVTAAPK